MPTLYVIETGARIEVEHERLLVTLEDEVLLRIPLRRVSQVVLVGRVGATTPALHALLERDIPLCFLSSRGAYLGRLVGAAGRNLPLRKAQYARDDDGGFCLALARAIARGKIANQYCLAARWQRRRSLDTGPARQALARLGQARDSAAQADDLDSLLGIEGDAAHAYFDLYQSLFDPAWGFTERNRRPPRDPVNALLSLGYTLLHTSLVSALELAGLDPCLGYYHADQYGRPALALDLEEEFRAPVVDSLVYQLVRWEQVTPADFLPGDDEPAAWLRPAALRDFAAQFSQKLESAVKAPGVDRPLAYRKHFEVQARRLAKCITGETADYQPFRIR